MPHGRPRNVAFVAIATTPKLRQNLRQTSRAPRHCLLVGASSGHQTPNEAAPDRQIRSGFFIDGREIGCAASKCFDSSHGPAVSLPSRQPASDPWPLHFRFEAGSVLDVEIVAGTRAVTVDSGPRLSKFPGLNDGFWVGLQADHDAAQAKDRIAADPEKIRPWAEQAHAG